MVQIEQDDSNDNDNCNQLLQHVRWWKYATEEWKRNETKRIVYPMRKNARDELVISSDMSYIPPHR